MVAKVKVDPHFVFDNPTVHICVFYSYFQYYSPYGGSDIVYLIVADPKPTLGTGEVGFRSLSFSI